MAPSCLLGCVVMDEKSAVEILNFIKGVHKTFRVNFEMNVENRKHYFLFFFFLLILHSLEGRLQTKQKSINSFKNMYLLKLFPSAKRYKFNFLDSLQVVLYNEKQTKKLLQNNRKYYMKLLETVWQHRWINICRYCFLKFVSWKISAARSSLR